MLSPSMQPLVGSALLLLPFPLTSLSGNGGRYISFVVRFFCRQRSVTGLPHTAGALRTTITTLAVDATTTGSSRPVPPARSLSRDSPSLHTSQSATRSHEPSAPSPPPTQTPDRTLPPLVHHQDPAPARTIPIPLSLSTRRAPLTRVANAHSPFLPLHPCRTDHPSAGSRDTKSPSPDSAGPPRPRKTASSDPFQLEAGTLPPRQEPVKSLAPYWLEERLKLAAWGALPPAARLPSGSQASSPLKSSDDRLASPGARSTHSRYS